MLNAKFNSQSANEILFQPPLIACSHSFQLVKPVFRKGKHWQFRALQLPPSVQIYSLDESLTNNQAPISSVEDRDARRRFRAEVKFAHCEIDISATLRTTPNDRVLRATDNDSVTTNKGDPTLQRAFVRTNNLAEIKMLVDDILPEGKQEFFAGDSDSASAQYVQGSVVRLILLDSHVNHSLLARIPTPHAKPRFPSFLSKRLRHRAWIRGRRA